MPGADEPWRPLSAREGQPRVDMDALHDGVPPWLEPSLWSWVVDSFYFPSGVGSPVEAIGWLKALERELRLPLYDTTRFDVLLSALHEQVRKDESLYLDVVDYLVHQDREPFEGLAIHRLRLRWILDQSGSVWRVREDLTALERRVSGLMQDLAQELVNRPGKAGEYLRTAWEQAFGRHPNASDSYRNSIRAVEAALIPIVSPTNARATLGTVIADVRKGPGKYKLRLTPKPPLEAVTAFADILGLLWTSQMDRHGTSDDSSPLTVSLEEAQDAVGIATSVLYLVASGGFAAT